jgi:hypothetical protein
MTQVRPEAECAGPPGRTSRRLAALGAALAPEPSPPSFVLRWSRPALPPRQRALRHCPRGPTRPGCTIVQRLWHDDIRCEVTWCSRGSLLK